MTNPAVFIVTGVVIAFAAVVAFFVYSANEPPMTSHGGRGRDRGTRYQPPSPPPSPIPRRNRRRRSSERRSNSPGTCRQQPATCQNCNEPLLITLNPCNHQALCRGCFETHLEKKDTCPICDRKISSCSPPIPLFGTCRSCRRFTKLFEFLNCNHSLSLCISCFEKQNLSCSVCTECDQRIEGSVPSYDTSGLCNVCLVFTKFAVFQPCRHANFCKRHALQYLERSGQECSECASRVTHIE